MVDPTSLKEIAAWLRNDAAQEDVADFEPPFDAWGDMLDAAAPELAAHRAASPLPSGPSVAERLVVYRCSAMTLVSWASGEGGNERSAVRAEAMAHAMLAAEMESGNG